MRKIILSSISAGLLLLPLIVLAQTGGPGIEPPTWGEVDIMIILDRIFDWLFVILLVVAAIFIVLAAYMFVTAQGDADKVKTARDFVLYALIGVLVAFVARGLIYLVDSIVRG